MNTFRIALVALALTIGAYALASMLAETYASDRPAFRTDPAKIISPSAGGPPKWFESISSFRSDLEGNQALTVAFQTLRSGKERSAAAEENLSAQTKVKRVLSKAPYNSDLWLALALLQAQRDPRDPALIEALKMSHFTAPNDAQLMPIRLDTATLYDALSDPDLKELARGDLRLMLTRQADLKAAVASAYRRASSLGKAFLEEAVQSIDPAFIQTLHSQKPT